MVNFLSNNGIIICRIILGILALAVAVIPTFFNIKRGGNDSVIKRLNYKGWMFLACIVLYFIVDTFKSHLEDLQQGEDKTDLFDKVDTLKIKVDSNLVKIDSLNKFSTQIIDSIGISFLELRKINRKLMQTAHDAEKQILKDVPMVFIDGAVKWEKLQGPNHWIKTNFRNNKGARIAKDFEATFFLFSTDKNDKVLYDTIYKETAFLFPPDTKRTVSMEFGNSKDIKKVNEKFYLLVSYKFKDSITPYIGGGIEGLSWQGFEKDSILFLNNDFDKQKALKYWKQKGIIIK